MKVTIVGGGVVGLCTAWYLSKAGAEVSVIEENDITDGCSFGNMGYISPSHFIPIATPGIIAQGLRWMMSSSSPFYIKPRLNMDLIRWGIAFRNSANAKTLNKNIAPLNNLLHLSRALMNDFKNELPESFDMIEKGCWALFKQDKTGDHEKELAEQAASLGLKTVVCNSAEVQSYEKEVEVDVRGGVLYLDDCHLNPASFMKSLFYDLQKKGVKFWLNTKVQGFETRGNAITEIITDKINLPVNEVILANGSWLGELSKMLQIKILMQPGKGYSVVYEGLKKNLQYPSILVDHRTATAPIGQRLRIGGTMEISGHNNTILPKRVNAIYNAFKQYYPSMEIEAPVPEKAWYGYRPVSPDGMPYIGRHSKYKNLVYAGGHAMLGLSAAAATGLLVEEIINGKPTSIEIKAFDPERFR